MGQWGGTGNYFEAKGVGAGVYEYKIDFGPRGFALARTAVDAIVAPRHQLGMTLQDSGKGRPGVLRYTATASD